MRNRKKTAVFASVVLAVALTLSACTSDNPDNGDNGGTTDTGGVTTTTIP